MQNGAKKPPAHAWGKRHSLRYSVFAQFALGSFITPINSGALPFMIYMKGRSSISSALSCGIPAPQ